ncbi:MAG: penicillin-resistant DD-carboxypeptidase [Cyanobacteria bacterium RYN_339]|nr:penicillin-resistant DD-carboxypeptidase [Cyanobacteria bacterium RYN_339]
MVDPTGPTRRAHTDGLHPHTASRTGDAEPVSTHAKPHGTAAHPGSATAFRGGSGSSTLGLPGAHHPKPHHAHAKPAHRAHRKRPRRHAARPHAHKRARARRAHAVKGAKHANQPGAVQGHAKGDFHTLVNFAQSRGFHVTSTNTGHHNVGSAHYQGRAIDVRVRDKTPAQVAAFKRDAQAHGFIVRDERSHPKGQKVWSGAHLHLEIPRRR